MPITRLLRTITRRPLVITLDVDAQADLTYLRDHIADGDNAQASLTRLVRQAAQAADAIAEEYVAGNRVLIVRPRHESDLAELMREPTNVAPDLPSDQLNTTMARPLRRRMTRIAADLGVRDEGAVVAFGLRALAVMIDEVRANARIQRETPEGVRGPMPIVLIGRSGPRMDGGEVATFPAPAAR